MSECRMIDKITSIIVANPPILSSRKLGSVQLSPSDPPSMTNLEGIAADILLVILLN